MAHLETPEDPAFLKAVAETLSAKLQSVLKEPLMKIAEEQVDKAVDEAMKDLDVKIKAWVDLHDMETTIKVVLDDKRKEPKP